jgi:tetratricopeptide (TPR) repeat protein
MMTARPFGRLGSAGSLIVIALLVASAAHAEENATITKTRWGKTARDETRVVFELDHSVAWSVNADPGGMVFEVRLTGAVPGTTVGPMNIRDARIDAVTIRDDERGTVARITSAGKPLRVKSFELADPPRVVLDLGPKDLEAPAPTAKAEPAAKAAPPKPAPPTPKLTAAPPQPAAPKAAAPVVAAVKPVRETPEPAAPAPVAPARRNSQEDFDDLMAWLHELDGRVETLGASRSEREQARGRRSLAYFLAERGISQDAERALTASLASDDRDRSAAPADSLFLAELRAEIGDSDGAIAIADDLAGELSSAPELLRVARVYSECRRPDAARDLLQKTLADLKGEDRTDGLLLLAQSHWDERDPESALPILETLTASDVAAGDTYDRALILQADCLWALSRTREARLRYERAARQQLPPDEASWVMLQLGNVARREGRLEDAKQHYRITMDRWPETFYASQAGWFLRVVEEIESAQRGTDGQDRG